MHLFDEVDDSDDCVEFDTRRMRRSRSRETEDTIVVTLLYGYH